MAADATAQPAATTTPATTPQVRRDDGATGSTNGRGVDAPEDRSSGAPTGLITFGAVAVAVVALIVGLVVGRRLLG
jgi:hypothetical protein